MEMLKIFNEGWYIDLDKLVSFFSDLKASEKEKTSIITNRYGGDDETYINHQDMMMHSKEMVESKSNFNTTLQQAKFETIRIFIDALFATYYDNDGSPINTLNPDELPLQQRFAFNTLVKAGILCKYYNNLN